MRTHVGNVFDQKVTTVCAGGFAAPLADDDEPVAAAAAALLIAELAACAAALAAAAATCDEPLDELLDDGDEETRGDVAPVSMLASASAPFDGRDEPLGGAMIEANGDDAAAATKLDASCDAALAGDIDDRGEPAEAAAAAEPATGRVWMYTSRNFLKNSMTPSCKMPGGATGDVVPVVVVVVVSCCVKWASG